MTHYELLAKINFKIEYCTCEGWGLNNCREKENIPWQALCAIVELHKPSLGGACAHCSTTTFWTVYPCLTIQAIEKELG